MEEKELKTSTKQRVAIILIAIIMLGSIIASYAAIVISSNNKNNANDGNTGISDEKKAQYEAEYEKQTEKFKEATKSYYDKFTAYKSEIKAYNEEAANEGGVKVKELEEGTGAELAEDGTNYLAFYAGWCADGSVFDSSFDDKDNPSGFSKALKASVGLIEGWTEGVKGMKLGGIRRITVPGELAYGDSMEICGGTNKPLRFLIMALPNEDPLKTEAEAIDTAFMRYQYAGAGIDYDEMMKKQ